MTGVVRHRIVVVLVAMAMGVLTILVSKIVGMAMLVQIVIYHFFVKILIEVRVLKVHRTLGVVTNVRSTALKHVDRKTMNPELSGLVSQGDPRATPDSALATVRAPVFKTLKVKQKKPDVVVILLMVIGMRLLLNVMIVTVDVESLLIIRI